jgi:hypothetical protein
MGRNLRFGLYFIAVTVVMPRESWAGSSQPPTVRVVIHDSTSVAERTLAEAREFSAVVFRVAGIEIDSVGDPPTCAAGGTARAFCVQVLLRPHNQQFEPGNARTMGVALAADANRAVVSVFLDAVADVARRYGQPLGKVLGIALAHEIGHVLLPPPSHSSSGIMQGSWEGDAFRHAIGGDIAFTDRQGALMRDRLKNRVPVP